MKTLTYLDEQRQLARQRHGKPFLLEDKTAVQLLLPKSHFLQELERKQHLARRSTVVQFKQKKK